MSNLENLTQKILDDAKQSASIILEEAKSKNEGIVNSRVMDAKEKSKKIIDKAIDEAKMAKDRVISNSELYVRDEKLKAKQGVMERIFVIAKDRLRNLNEEDYVIFLQKTLKDLNLNGTETLVVPEHLKNKLKTTDISNKISDTRVVESGFLIEDGKIVINYTFESLVDYLREELEAEIAQVVFKE